MKECDEKVDEEDWNVRIMRPLDTLRSNDKKDELWEEGFLRISTDGSVDDPEHQRLARCGAGIYFGKKHPYNIDSPVNGVDMNSYRTKTSSGKVRARWDEGVGHEYLDHAGQRGCGEPCQGSDKRENKKAFRKQVDWAP